MKRLLCYLAAAAACVAAVSLTVRADNAPGTSASSAILVYANTGEALYEQNADSRMLVASTTKLMTALVAAERCGPDDPVEIKAEDVGVEGSSMYLAVGEAYTVRDLLHGLILASGNDAALALARYTAGSVADFVALMNEKAAALGMGDTAFQNPHGLDADGHYSTARDLARLMAAVMENGLLREIVGTGNYTCREQTYVNHNKLLWTCEGVIGGKTGYTMAAGRVLVSCCERNGMLLICATIADPDDWKDHATLYDWAYDRYCADEVFPAGSILTLPVISGTADRVSVEAEGGARVLRERDAPVTVRYFLPRFVYADVRAGEAAGSAVAYVDGVEAAEVKLVYAATVSRDERMLLTAWERFKRAWYMANRYGYAITWP